MMGPSSKEWLGKLDRRVWQEAEIQAGSNPCPHLHAAKDHESLDVTAREDLIGQLKRS